MLGGLTVTEATDAGSVIGLERWQPAPAATAKVVTTASASRRGASRWVIATP